MEGYGLEFHWPSIFFAPPLIVVGVVLPAWLLILVFRYGKLSTFRKLLLVPVCIVGPFLSMLFWPFVLQLSGLVRITPDGSPAPYLWVANELFGDWSEYVWVSISTVVVFITHYILNRNNYSSIMRRIFRVTGYIVFGIAILLVAANQFIFVTGGGGPHGEDQGIIGFLLSEKVFVKKKTVRDQADQSLDHLSHYKWKETCERESRKIILSYEAIRKAESVFAKKTPDNFNSSDMKDVVTALEQALKYAELVPDDVLDWIHPQMNIQFRQNYQTALVKMLNGFKNRDQNSAIEGSKLYEKYRTWAFSHRQEFSFPIE